MNPPEMQVRFGQLRQLLNEVKVGNEASLRLCAELQEAMAVFKLSASCVNYLFHHSESIQEKLNILNERLKSFEEVMLEVMLEDQS